MKTAGNVRDGSIYDDRILEEHLGDGDTIPFAFPFPVTPSLATLAFGPIWEFLIEYTIPRIGQVPMQPFVDFESYALR